MIVAEVLGAYFCGGVGVGVSFGVAFCHLMSLLPEVGLVAESPLLPSEAMSLPYSTATQAKLTTTLLGWLEHHLPAFF